MKARNAHLYRNLIEVLASADVPQSLAAQVANVSTATLASANAPLQQLCVQGLKTLTRSTVNASALIKGRHAHQDRYLIGTFAIVDALKS